MCLKATLRTVDSGSDCFKSTNSKGRGELFPLFRAICTLEENDPTALFVKNGKDFPLV